jgi:hypothetical protein
MTEKFAPVVVSANCRYDVAPNASATGVTVVVPKVCIAVSDTAANTSSGAEPKLLTGVPGTAVVAVMTRAVAAEMDGPATA